MTRRAWFAGLIAYGGALLAPGDSVQAYLLLVAGLIITALAPERTPKP